MKNFYFILFSFVLIACQEKSNHNYIDNYYQLVYKADIAYLQEDFKTTYDLLKQAEANCPLLNQPIYYEVDRLAELSVKFNKNDDALNYIERLVKEEGYEFSNFENDDFYRKPLESYDKWKDLKQNHIKYQEAYLSNLNLELREEIKKMKVLDQMYRKRGEYDWKKCDSIDNINEARMKQIIKQYGFPTEKIIGAYRLDNSSVSVSAMFMHFSDTAYFKKVLIPLVKQGKCPPEIYPNMIDSRQRETREFIYGIYSNSDESDIIDFKNLNKRRVAVGLPTKEIQTKRYNIFSEKINRQ